MENLKDMIYKRKSTRKYDMSPVDADTLKRIREFGAEIQPLYDGIKIEYEITESENIRGLFAVKSPHYLLISSDTKEGYLTNAGFMLQQITAENPKQIKGYYYTGKNDYIAR